MRCVRIGYVLFLYFLMLLLKMMVNRIFEESWDFLDNAIYSGLWTITFLALLWVIEKNISKASGTVHHG